MHVARIPVRVESIHTLPKLILERETVPFVVDLDFLSARSYRLGRYRTASGRMIIRTIAMRDEHAKARAALIHIPFFHHDTSTDETTGTAGAALIGADIKEVFCGSGIMSL